MYMKETSFRWGGRKPQRDSRMSAFAELTFCVRVWMESCSSLVWEVENSSPSSRGTVLYLKESFVGL